MLGTPRRALTNCHLASLCFTGLAIVDLLIGPWHIADTSVVLKVLFLVLCLPLYVLHVADHFVFPGRGGFRARSAALLHRLARRLD